MPMTEVSPYRLFALVLSALVSISCGSVPSAQQVDLYDSVAPEITEWMADPAILVFSKTKGWRHNEGIAGADLYFARLAQRLGYGLFTTENGAVFNDEDLSRFDVIIFNNMTGDALSPDQEAAFQHWLEAGGAWIGLHSAGDNSHKDWNWYDRQVIGPEFIGHPADPQFQKARVVNLAPDHPIMKELPTEWTLTDEWYSFDSIPQSYGLTPLAGLDEATYDPKNLVYGDYQDLRMGEGAINHPIIWSQCMGDARLVYTGIGHGFENYENATYAGFLERAFRWVTKAVDPGGEGCDSPDEQKAN